MDKTIENNNNINDDAQSIISDNSDIIQIK